VEEAQRCVLGGDRPASSPKQYRRGHRGGYVIDRVRLCLWVDYKGVATMSPLMIVLIVLLILLLAGHI
jgi:hypothetical protein